MTIVAVGDANIKKSKLAIFKPEGPLTGGLARLQSIIVSNFSFYKSKYDVSAEKISSSNLNFNSLKNRKIDLALTLKVGPGASKIIGTLYKVSTLEKVEVTQSINQRDIRHSIHELSDNIFRIITGKDSIFKSHILFVSDRNSSRSQVIKELYIMDFDGQNKKQLTNHRGFVISPALSFSGDKVLYSLIPPGKNKKRNVNLYLKDLNTGKVTLLSSRKGLNSGAVFLPGDKEIAVTLSSSGNAEIYIMNLATKKTKRITKHYAPDVDPSINRDGSLLTFLSGRFGQPMVFTMDPNGVEKNVKRISYVGKFNATPRFSPDGKQIAFSSWIDNRFDIVRINSDGTGLYRLTKDFGSNEDPTFSNDGEFIAFSSQRVLSRKKAVQNIYIMDKDGEILGPVTSKYGNCITPRWSK